MSQTHAARPTGNAEQDLRTLIALVSNVAYEEDWEKTDDGEPSSRRELLDFLEKGEW